MGENGVHSDVVAEDITAPTSHVPALDWQPLDPSPAARAVAAEASRSGLLIENVLPMPADNLPVIVCRT